MIELKLNTGEDVILTPIQKENGVYELRDDNGIVRLKIKLDANNFTVEDKGDIIESDEILDDKLYLLAKRLFGDEQTGVEQSGEDELPQNPEDDPFNPEEISIDTKPVTMETLLRRLEQGTIKLNPDFQRQEVWNPERKSQLIESLILKIPIPMFYVSSDEKANWTVVDGLQRISTIRDFVLGAEYLKDTKKNIDKKGCGLRLKGLEFWKELKNKQLNELPTHLYNRILETEFSFTIINPGTPEEVKRNVFKRLNTGGMPLSSQEIRNALYIGKATSLLNKLASLEVFKDATGRSIHSERMEDKELILRFVSFYLRNYSTYTKTVTIDTWLSDTMIILNAYPLLDSREFNKSVKAGSIIKDNINRVDEESITNAFLLAMTRAKVVFGEHAFRKSYHGIRRAPINKSLFETWSIILANLSDSEYEQLINNKAEFVNEYKPMLDDWQFIIAISRDSMKHGAVKYRFEKLCEIVNKYTYKHD